MNAYGLNRKLSLLAAVLKGDLDGVKAAVENGGDIKERLGLGKTTVLHYACRWGYFSITELLIQRGAEVNCGDRVGNLPIHSACWDGNLEIVKLLISKGSDFTSTNGNGHTPLDIALYFGHTGVVEYLIQRAAEAGN